MKVALTVIGVIVILLLFGTMMGGINDAQTDLKTDNFAAVVTGGGITTADVVLVTDLYGGDVLNVTNVTSDLGTDVPLAFSYAALTRTLTINGLTAAQTRTLSVIYKYDALTGDSATVGSFFGIIPLLVAVAVIAIIAGVIYMAFKNR
jgi:hypothetical protein